MVPKRGPPETSSVPEILRDRPLGHDRKQTHRRSEKGWASGQGNKEVTSISASNTSSLEKRKRVGKGGDHQLRKKRSRETALAGLRP